MTVLIADDAPNMIATVRSMLKVLKYGNKFHSATNGAEAWRILKKEPIDLAILDYVMPTLSGVELLSRIREDRDLRDLPVVMVTAQAHSDFVADAAESEIDAYILKPATVKVLGDKIVTVIENANNPPPMTYHLKEARRFEECGDLDAAINEAKLAMKANPASSRPLRELGYYYLRKDNIGEAKKYLLKAARMNSLDVLALHYLGELYAKANDMQSASEYFEKAMHINPRHTTRAIQFGMTLIERKMIEKGIHVFDKALELLKYDLKAQEEIADFCMSKGAHEYAASILESIVKEDPKRHDLFFKLGVTLEQLGQHSKALMYLDKALKADKENLDIRLHLARVYLALGKAIRAEKSLLEVLEADPENKEAVYLLKQCT
jgi:CheY-like chemotaxis protein